jgi:hypothetical protein
MATAALGRRLDRLFALTEALLTEVGGPARAQTGPLDEALLRDCMHMLLACQTLTEAAYVRQHPDRWQRISQALLSPDERAALTLRRILSHPGGRP